MTMKNTIGKEILDGFTARTYFKSIIVSNCLNVYLKLILNKEKQRLNHSESVGLSG